MEFSDLCVFLVTLLVCVLKLKSNYNYFPKRHLLERIQGRKLQNNQTGEAVSGRRADDMSDIDWLPFPFICHHHHHHIHSRI
jgi:hypothetical protein